MLLRILKKFQANEIFLNFWSNIVYNYLVLLYKWCDYRAIIVR